MKEKKNIDEFFKEGFKTFEANPSPRVWENIQSELKKNKKERKVIPLWIRIGSVAALLALLVSVGNWVFSPQENQQVITNENKLNLQDQKRDKQEHLIPDVNNPQVASEETSSKNESSTTDSDYNTHAKNNDEAKTSQKSVKSSLKKSASTGFASNTSERDASTGFASNTSERDASTGANDNSDKNSLQKKNSKIKSAEGVASSENKFNKKDSRKKKNPIITEDGAVLNKKQEIAVKVKTESNNFDTLPLAEKNLLKTDAVIAEESKNKKSIFEAIAEKDERKSSEINKKESLKHRWKIAPNVAPVYYSSLGNGSSIDPSFTDNPQKGDVNMSYGVQVSYALNERLSLRTGVSNLDLSYSTSDIIVGTGPVGAALNSVDYGQTGIVVTAIDRTTFETSMTSGGFGEITKKSTQGDARLIQNINYLEVPLELKYAVIDSKFGLNLIGGVSTLFLGNNEVSVKADNFTSVLGEANNLSSVSFSTNVGLGLDYKISRKFTFNIEPMFKYQLNPYSDSSVNFKPYYLGVYSGFSFRF